MLLSVVILNYNVRHFLELCLLSVERAIAGLDAEIIVVDNNSPDDSCAMVKAKFPSVRLIENKDNPGFPKGNNIGVAQAKGEYICILNPDTVVAEDTFTKILRFAQSQPKLGVVGCKLIDGSGDFLPESKRGVPTPFTAFTKIAGLYTVFPKLFGKYYAMHLKPGQTGRVEILVGAFMVMKREVYLEVGGFDEDCFMYSDDIDLSYTILKTGRENFYFADAAIIHFKGESTVKDGLYMQRFRDAMNFFYKKHFRVSAVFDWFMQMGAWWFARRKKNTSAQKIQPASFAIVSPDAQLVDKAANLLGKNNVVRASLDAKDLNSLQPIPVQYWFDVRNLAFADMIRQMQTGKQGDTYRFVISDAAIGSDSSVDRGEVIRL